MNTLQDAIQAQKSSRLDEARRIYESLLKKNPNDPVVLHNLAILLVQKNDIELGYLYSKQAVIVDNSSPLFQSTFIKIAIRAAKFHDAWVVLLAENDQLYIHSEILGVIEAFFKEWIKFNKVEMLRFDPVENLIFKEVEQKAKERSLKQAVVQCATLLKTHPMDWRLYYLVAHCFSEFKQYQIAKHYASLGCLVGGTQYLLENLLANCEFSLGDIDAALTRFSRVIDLKPNFLPAHIGKARCFKEKGKFDEALSVFTAASTTKNAFDDVLTNELVELYAQSGHIQLAFEFVMDSYQKLPTPTKLQNLLYMLPQLNVELKDNLSINRLIKCVYEQKLQNNPKVLICIAILALISGSSNSFNSILTKIETLGDHSLNINLNEQDRKFTSGYSTFLKMHKGKVYQKRENNLELYHLGDSHCLSFIGNGFSAKTKQFCIQPLLTFGAKAFHLSLDRANVYKGFVDYKLKNLPSNSHVMVSFGEIDCRSDEGFIKAADKNQNIHKLIDDTTTGYVRYLRQVKQKNSLFLLVCCLQVPKYNKNLTKEQNLRVLSVTKEFNERLRVACKQLDLQILDLEKHTAPNGGFSPDEIYYDNYHLRHEFFDRIKGEIVNWAIAT